MSVSGWRQRLRAAVSPLEDGVRPLRVRGYRPPGSEHLRPSRTAAVLVPILEAPEPHIVLTMKSRHLAQHAGQVSFPGGGAEPGDKSAVHTALREAHEEISLPSGAVTPLGFLDRIDTVSDYRVLPVVGWVEGAPKLRPDGVEVEEVFTIPAAIALDRGRFQHRLVERDGREYRIWSLPWQGRVIWGATAAILIDLANRLDAQREEGAGCR